MKDFPFFTTQNGAAGLTLQEVPYNHKAYITIHDTRDLPALIKECVDFCKAVGAETVYACNHRGLEEYPVYTRVVLMERSLADLPETEVSVVPVTLETLAEFQKIYNEKMRVVPAARYLTSQRMNMLLQEEDCCFVCRGGVVAGIGIVSDGMISAIASLQPGAGEDVVLALCSRMSGERVRLEVAEINEKAMQLYTRLGFQTVDVINIWHKVY